MINIESFYKFLCYYRRGKTEIDLVHSCLIFGTVLSQKPERALELGIGNGYATMSILHALKHNTVGKLTSVDNWCDWAGREPSHIEGLRKLGVNVIVMEEGDFVRSQPDNSYNFLLSDGSHRHAHEWAVDVFRIIKPGGVMFFHDIKSEAYPGLRIYTELCKERELSYFIFSKNSREDERCNRGLLMAVNK